MTGQAREEEMRYTLYRDYTKLARRCDISQSSVGSPKNAENRCKSFLSSQRGDVTASLRRLWRFYGVPVEYYRGPAEF